MDNPEERHLHAHCHENSEVLSMKHVSCFSYVYHLTYIDSAVLTMLILISVVILVENLCKEPVYFLFISLKMFL